MKRSLAVRPGVGKGREIALLFMRILHGFGTAFNELQVMCAQALKVAQVWEGVMLRYEVLTCKNGRWTADSILDTRDAAVEQAQALANRNYLISAVRVMALEDDTTGFKERMVFNCRVSRMTRTGSAAPTVGDRPQATGKSTAKRKPSGIGARILVVVLVLACAAMVGYGLLAPQKPWVFDTPDARKPHLLRNPFTGEFS